MSMMLLAAVTEQELGTIIAALRHYQDSLGAQAVPFHIILIANNEFKFPALNFAEIDALCERLNTECLPDQKR